MNLITIPITGNESIEKDATPFNALVDFYRAFNTRDMTLMNSNWENSLEASMSNPLGGVRRGGERCRACIQKYSPGRLKSMWNSMIIRFIRRRKCSMLLGESVDIFVWVVQKLRWPFEPAVFSGK